ncbi:MAG: nitroreductase/quinone reductase family protein [Nitrososphaera sp.]
MSKADIYQRLNKAYEIGLSVKGRKSGRDIPRPVWFAHEGNTLYLLPVQGSDTNWYKNLLVDSTLKISVNGGGGEGEEIPARGKPITDSNRVDGIVGKFKSKYGKVKQYYPKVDVAVEVPP